MSNEFSNNLPPSAKSYYFNYLQGFDWYKAQLLSLTGPLAGGGVQQSGQPQNQTQQTAQTNNATASSTNTTRIKIDGQVTNVDERNKTFSIQTNQGALTLKIPRNPLPPEGLRIEIDIPRPREGQQISFRPLPRDQQSTAIQQQISQTAPPIADEPQNIQPPRSKPSAPLIDTTALPRTVTANPVAPDTIAAPLIKQGAIITLTPLPPAQIDQLIPLDPPDISKDVKISQSAAQNTPDARAYISDSKIALPLPNAYRETDSSIKIQPASTNIIPDTKNITQHNLNLINPNSSATLTLTSAPVITAQTALPQAQAIAALLNIAAPNITAAPENTAISAPIVTAPPAQQPDLKNVPPVSPSEATAPPNKTPAAIMQPMPQAIKIEQITTPAAQNTAAQTPQVQVTPSATLSTEKAPNPNITEPPSTTAPPQTAEFVGKTADEKPVVAISNTSSGSSTASTNYFVLDAQSQGITQGTKISFTASNERAAAPSTAQAPAANIAPQAAMATIPPYAFPLTSGSGQWPALEDITQSLQNTAPQIAQNLLQQSPNISSPAMKMEPAILFFLAAARSGDIAGWFGDKASEMLRRAGKGNAMSKILQDFVGLSRPSHEAGSTSPAPEWRSMPLPLFAYNEAHKIMLHYRYDENKQDGEDHDRKKAMRFVIDLDLHRMGDVQLDGFAQTGRLDLIVRTQNPLSADMQQIMRRKYSGSLEYTGFKGELSFHGAQDKFVKIEAVSDKSGFSI